MEATTLFAPKFLLALASNSVLQSRQMGIPRLRRKSTGKVFARANDPSYSDYRGRLVDEGMIVLRKRIHEMKVMEGNYEPPVEWTEWEKQCYACYDDVICNFVGLIQCQLMNTRPGLALGMLVLVLVSVPTSTAIFISHLAEATAGVLNAVQLN